MLRIYLDVDLDIRDPNKLDPVGLEQSALRRMQVDGCADPMVPEIHGWDEVGDGHWPNNIRADRLLVLIAGYRYLGFLSPSSDSVWLQDRMRELQVEHYPKNSEGKVIGSLFDTLRLGGSSILRKPFSDSEIKTQRGVVVIDDVKLPPRNLILRRHDTKQELTTDELRQFLLKCKIDVQALNPPPEKSTLANRLIDLRELGRHLGHYRPLFGAKGAGVPKSLANAAAKVSDDQWLPPNLPEGLVEFEEGRCPGQRPLKELRTLLDAYTISPGTSDMPQLLAEWMLSEPVDGPIIKHDLKKFDPASNEESPLKGAACTYSLPVTRLNGTDCAFVKVVLPSVEKHQKEFQKIIAEVEKRSPSRRTARRSNVINPHGQVSLGALDRLEGVVGPTEYGSLRNLVPHSLPHQHPGDELIIVLKGSVVVELDDTGIRTRLQEHDYTHFLAEIPHSIWNVSLEEEAEVLVIRFFQLNRIGSRRRRYEGLVELLKLIRTDMPPMTRGSGVVEQLQGLVLEILEYVGRLNQIYPKFLQLESWLHSLTQPPVQRVDDKPEELRDFVGMAHLLRLMLVHNPNKITLGTSQEEVNRLVKKLMSGDKKPEISSTDLNKLLKVYDEVSSQIIRNLESKSLQFDSDKPLPQIAENLKSLFLGRRPDDLITHQYLQLLADYFKIPRVLLDGVLIPAVPRSVVVRNNGRDRILPPAIDEKHTGHGTVYRLPCRALADSDISITFLSWGKANCCCQDNGHMGYEFALCLSGTIRVELSGSVPELLEANQCAHYRSSIMHRLECVKAPAEVLVIRFNELDPASMKRDFGLSPR